VLSMLLAVTALLPAPSEAAPAAASRTKLVPRSGALFGAWVDLQHGWTNNEDAEREVTTFEEQIGRRLDIDHHYYAWTDRFPSGLEEWDIANGRIPMITWKGTTLTDILGGEYDGMIRARARGVRDLHRPVFLRWGWEMNGQWEAWSGARNGGAEVGPARYVSAWQHIHRIFTAMGATNAVWVWAPAHQDGPPHDWNHWTHYYPGDGWVDWVGIDGFNWGAATRWGHWASFTDLIEPVYRDYAGRKPIMIAETGTTRVGGSKVGWFQDARDDIETVFPRVRAIVYFNAHDGVYPVDWRVTTSAASGSAFKAWGSDPYFHGDGPRDRPAVEGAFVWPRDVVDWTRVAFTIAAPAQVSIEIRNDAGAPVRHLLTGATYDHAGSFAVEWDRTNDMGQRVPPGTYTATVTATDESGTSVAQSDCSFDAS
jgi:hypothetical protein